MTYLGLSFTSDPTGPVFAAVTETPGQAEVARVLGRFDSAQDIRDVHPDAEIVEVHPAGSRLDALTDLEVLDRSIQRGVVVVDVVEKTVAAFSRDGSITIRPFSRAALSDATISAPLQFTVCLVHPDNESLTDEFVILSQDFNVSLVARSSIAAWALDIHTIPVEDTLATYGAAALAQPQSKAKSGNTADKKPGLFAKLFGR